MRGITPITMLGVGVASCASGCSTAADGTSTDSPNGGASAGNAAAGTTATQGGSSAGQSMVGGEGGVTSVAGSTTQAGSAGAGTCGGDGSAKAAPIMITECPAPPAEAPAGAAAALDSVNELRSAMGVPCMALVPEINVSAQKHCDYYQQNLADKPCIANAHAEVDTCAGFVAAGFSQRMTAAGYTGSPRSEVMAFSGDPPRAVAQWINSVYHRTPLVSPWIREMGYGGTEDCDTIDMGQGPKTPDDVTAVYPYPYQVDVPIEFDGSHEGPMPPEPPSGWPSASPVHLFAKSYTVTSHEIFASQSCAPLSHQWLPEKDHYILYSDAPFAKNTEYRVRIAGTRGGEPLSFDWTFTTGR